MVDVLLLDSPTMRLGSAWLGSARLRVHLAGLDKSLLYMSAWRSSGVLNWSHPMTEGTRDQHLRAPRCFCETLLFQFQNHVFRCWEHLQLLFMATPRGGLGLQGPLLSSGGEGRSQGASSEYQLWLPNWWLPQTKIHDKLQYLPSLHFLMCVWGGRGDWGRGRGARNYRFL